MRHARNIYRLFALAGVLGVVAWGCSTDSPTAPNQTPAPLPPGPPGQAFSIAVGSTPRGIALPEMPTGLENTSVVVEVNPAPPDGTTVSVTTNIGQFDPVLPITATGRQLINGRAFLTLYAGLPIQRGIATVQASLEAGQGELDVPIEFFFADFNCSNPEANTSVNFINTSAANASDFLWDFGDGTTSTERSPHHVYAAPGEYSVQLVASTVIAQVALETSIRKPVDTAATGCTGGAAAVGP